MRPDHALSRNLCTLLPPVSLQFVGVRSLSLMKLFKTASAAVGRHRLKFFTFLPETYQIDIRIFKFLERFMISDTVMCMLFERHAKIWYK